MVCLKQAVERHFFSKTCVREAFYEVLWSFLQCNRILGDCVKRYVTCGSWSFVRTRMWSQILRAYTISYQQSGLAPKSHLGSGSPVVEHGEITVSFQGFYFILGIR